MISKPLLKQSIKANGLVWVLVTFITAFMLGIIIIVLSGINSNGIRNSLQDSFVKSELEANFKGGAIDGYTTVYDNVVLMYPSAKETYDQVSLLTTNSIQLYNMYKLNNHPNPKDITLSKILQNTPDDKKTQVTVIVNQILIAYENNQLMDNDQIYTFKSQLTINLMLEGMGNNIDEATRRTIETISQQILDIYSVNNDLTDEDKQVIARLYIENSFYENLIKNSENSKEMLEALGFKTMEELLSYYGYTQTSIKALVTSGIIQYTSFINSGTNHEDAKKEVTKSLLSQMPEDVGKSLKELGELNINHLVIGTTFYKMAGLLLPIVYTITTANNLIAGQVDSGSMAYVLSTPTKRKKVTFTQMIFLVGSLILMYIIIGLVGIGATAIAKEKDFNISISEILKLNIGALTTMISISGICFLASAWFNRSKNSVGVGGGISMFFLVSTILGLFGSNTIPEALRIQAMNVFNYTTIITLFDANKILEGSNSYIWGLLILLAIAIVTYIIGIIKFEKKDLPL